MKQLNYCILILICLAASACTIHHLEIQQGIVMKKSALDRLKLGMTETQVVFLLGEPPIKDPFHQGRWDYIYTLKASEKKAQQSHIVLYFKDQKLVKKRSLQENRGLTLPLQPQP